MLTHTRFAITTGLLGIVVLTAGCASDSVGSNAAPTVSAMTIDGAAPVKVVMQDIKYDQTTLAVKAGETIDFRFTNTGKITHDAFIGDNDAQMEHETEMAQMGNMSHTADEAAITVQPGAAGELAYTFTEPGTYEVGCHQPGHYGAGMKIEVTVE